MTTIAKRTTSYDKETRSALLGQPAKSLVRVALSEQSIALIQGASRALAPVSGTAGGFLVGQSMADAFFAALSARSSIWSLASLDITESGEERAYPGGDDTANVGSVAQPGGDRTTVTDPTFRAGISRPVTITSGIVRIPWELAQDSGAGGIESIIANLLATRVRSALDRVALVGAGGTEPAGLFTGGRIGVTGPMGTATTFSYENLVDLIANIAAPYRVTPASEVIGKFLMAPATLQAGVKILDGSGRPIVEHDPVGKAGPTMLGYPVVEDSHAPAMAASANSIAFGSFADGVVLRIVEGVKLIVLRESYAASGQLAYLCEVMADTVLVNPQAFALYQHSAS